MWSFRSKFFSLLQISSSWTMSFFFNVIYKNRIEYYIHQSLFIEIIRNIEDCEIFVVKKIRRNWKKYEQHIAFHERFDSKILIDVFYKKQRFKIIKRLRFELRQTIRSSKFERFRKKSILIILQFDQRYIQQIEIFNRNLSNSYDWIDRICLRKKLQNVINSVAINKSIYYISNYISWVVLECLCWLIS